MRILAIRGCNLASLAGEFEIDLAAAPLGEAGVFAIVGPTGAGKSTLLDAMCVALFDRTPRLTNRSTVVVGRGEDDPAALGAQDVRTLLRRGASAGYAEVDFESGDARRYRARWSVRRARNAADGNLQDAQVSLLALDGHPGVGERLGGTKTETLKAIHQRLGLSFDQFRRSALLAQGEFAAFLRADGKDRSELLERMTGTEIYSKLSIAAHQRAAQAEQLLRDGRHAALAIAVLADDVRVGTEHELAGAREAVEQARARHAASDAAAKWLGDLARRQAALDAAEHDRALALRTSEAADGQRAELVVRRRAEGLRGAWEDAARVERQLAIARGEVQAAGERATTARAAHATVIAELAELGELHAPIRDARIAAGLVEREDGDAGLSAMAAVGERGEPVRRGASGQGDRGGAIAAGVRLTDAVRARARAVGADAAWLLERRGLAGEIGAWRDLEASFDAHAALLRDIETIDRGIDEHVRRREVLFARQQAAIDEQRRANQRLEEARQQADAFAQRRGLSLDAAAKQEKEARAAHIEADKLVAIAGEARAAATARQDLVQQFADLQAATDSDAEMRAITEEQRIVAIALRDERQRAVLELRRAAGHEHARTELVAGEPCPLCGATEHPWAGRGAFDALIADGEERLGEATMQLDAAIDSLAAIKAREDQRARERTRLDACLATIERAASSALVKWREQLAALGELVLVGDPAGADAQRLATERAAAARSRLEAAGAARSHAEAVAKASQEAQARVHARANDLSQCADQVKSIETQLSALVAAVERLAGERTAKHERAASLATSLTAAIARWHAALPSTERARLAPTEALRAALSGAHVGAASFTPAVLEACRRMLAELASTWTRHADTIARADAALAAIRREIDRAGREAERQVAEHEARHAAAERRVGELDVEARSAGDALETARAAAGFTRDELARLLASPPGRVDEIAEHLATIDRQLHRATTLVAERQRLVDDARAAMPTARADAAAAPALPADAAGLAVLAATETTRAAELHAAVVAAEKHAAQLAAALVADDAARVRRAAALASVEVAEQAAEIDRVLGEVIGSHDGKLFRSFAQSLTLDGLLAVANSHLEELAPRYQLERVPRHDLELQVIDRDLGGEIRSVQSLSGGESFLVSLALALGLSSMSAHDVRVRTLLIDEGFGTLDPATLDTALAVLDALQATGRQVGVISHVPALVERVGAHVRVMPRGGGRSDVVVRTA